MKQSFLILTVVIGCGLWACKEEPPLPYNPYDDIIYPIDQVPVDTLGANSLTRVHKEVFSPKCNVLGCHDGSFEPDFRTPQSTYSTLVYHPIVKNNAEESFKYRVIPFNKEESVLWERITNCCFVNDNDRMPQDNIGISMPESAINQIGDWITAGAPDLFGNTASEPNMLPNIYYYAVMDLGYDSAFHENKVNGIYYNPFIMPANTDVNIIIAVDDDLTPIEELQYNTLLIGMEIDDFSNANSYTATGVDAGGYGYFYVVSINTSIFNSNQQYFMRYYANDGVNAENAEYPETGDANYYKSIWSFVLE